MKTKSYAEKPWWPVPRFKPAPAARLDRLAVFRHQVACAARRMGLPRRVQNYAVAAVTDLTFAALRPDLGRQAQEWVTQHQKLPRAVRPARPPRTCPVRLAAPRFTPPRPATLAREALAFQWIEVDQITFREVAARLGITREQARQIHARARRRRRQHHFLLA